MKSISRSFAVVFAVLFCTAVQADHHHKPVDLVGVWDVVASSDGNSREITWTFKQEGKKVTGVSFDHENSEERDLDRVTVKDKKAILEIDVEQDGNKGVIRVEAEEKTPGKLVGKWSVVGEDGTSFMDGKLEAVKQVVFAGEWDATSTLPDGTEIDSVLSLKGKNDKLKGVLESDSGELEIKKVAAKDGQLSLDFNFDMNGDSIHCIIKSKPQGNDKLVGNWVVLGEGGDEVAEGDWSAVRKPRGLAGVWNVVAAVPNNADFTGTLTLTQENGKYAGVSKGDNRDASPLKSVKVDGKELEYSTAFEGGGASGIITVTAVEQADGSLDGEWVFVGSDGNEQARDSWKATRE